jgi:pyruvate kinase
MQSTRTAQAPSTAAPSDGPEGELGALLEELEQLRAEMQDREAEAAELLRGLSGSRRDSAANLAHYLALRSRDVRGLQDELACRGLSSLGRSEACVLASLNAVREVLRRLHGGPGLDGAAEGPVRGPDQGKALLAERTEALLGPPPAGREVRIMVTMPSEAADDPGLIRSLLAGGMD